MYERFPGHGGEYMNMKKIYLAMICAAAAACMVSCGGESSSLTEISKPADTAAPVSQTEAPTETAAPEETEATAAETEAGSTEKPSDTAADETSSGSSAEEITATAPTDTKAPDVTEPAETQSQTQTQTQTQTQASQPTAAAVDPNHAPDNGIDWGPLIER